MLHISSHHSFIRSRPPTELINSFTYHNVRHKTHEQTPCRKNTLNLCSKPPIVNYLQDLVTREVLPCIFDIETPTLVLQK